MRGDPRTAWRPLAVALLVFLSCRTTPAGLPLPPLPSRGWPELGQFGFDAAGMDLRARPGDDFFQFSGGSWLGADLPPWQSRASSLDLASYRVEVELETILAQLAASGPAPGSLERKLVDFYATARDSEAIDRRGFRPAQPVIDELEAAGSHEALAALIGRPGLPTRSPIECTVALDSQDPDRFLATIHPSGLGLGEPARYLRRDAATQGLLADYTHHLARVLALAGLADAWDRAQAVTAFETAVARLRRPLARGPEALAGPRRVSRAELAELAPAWPWAAMLGAAGLEGQATYQVVAAERLRPLAELFRLTPLPVLKAYLAYHFLAGRADVLPEALEDEFFTFHGRALEGALEQVRRRDWSVTSIDSSLAEALGRRFAVRRFPPLARATLEAMVEEVRQAFRARIEAADWLSPAGKAGALEKLAAIKVKLGAPEVWRDFSGLEVVAGDAYGNAERAARYDWAEAVARLGRPADREAWDLHPHTLNASYNRAWNELVLPAALLQPPLFDPAADPAVNFGGLGAVIGHELGHAFDDQGARYDGAGRLRTWWEPGDAAGFQQRLDRLVAQYQRYEPRPGLGVDGQLTVGENLADVAGLSVALEAYHRSLAGRPAPVLSGFTGDQRFFHAFAQMRRRVIREEALRGDLVADPHAPGRYRVNGAVRNLDAWYDAFQVRPGDALYLPPEERVHPW